MYEVDLCTFKDFCKFKDALLFSNGGSNNAGSLVPWAFPMIARRSNHSEGPGNEVVMLVVLVMKMVVVTLIMIAMMMTFFQFLFLFIILKSHSFRLLMNTVIMWINVE